MTAWERLHDRPQEATGGWITTEKQMEKARRRQEAGPSNETGPMIPFAGNDSQRCCPEATLELYMQVSAEHGRSTVRRWRDRAVVRYRWMAGLLGACIALINASASGQVVSGDTLVLNGTLYRLYGIDAPERNQYCSDGWPAGSLAKARLQSLIDGTAVDCEARERDTMVKALPSARRRERTWPRSWCARASLGYRGNMRKTTLTRRRGRRRKVWVFTPIPALHRGYGGPNGASRHASRSLPSRGKVASDW